MCSFPSAFFSTVNCLTLVCVSCPRSQLHVTLCIGRKNIKTAADTFEKYPPAVPALMTDQTLLTSSHVPSHAFSLRKRRLGSDVWSHQTLGTLRLRGTFPTATIDQSSQHAMPEILSHITLCAVECGCLLSFSRTAADINVLICLCNTSTAKTNREVSSKAMLRTCHTKEHTNLSLDGIAFARQLRVPKTTCNDFTTHRKT